MLQLPKKKIACVLSTYKDLRSEKDFIINTFLEGIKKLTQRGVSPKAIVLYFINGKVKILKYNSRNWNTAVKEIEAGSLNTLLLTFMKDSSLEDSIASDALLQIVICNHQITRNINKSTYSPNEVCLMFDPEIVCLENNEIISWIERICFKIDCIYGFSDFLPTGDPHGVCMSVKHDGISEAGFYSRINMNEKLRGYFWLNILNEKHIELLGGLEYVIENLPYYFYKQIRLQNGKTVYLFQTMNSYDDFDPDKYLELKHFIYPILEKEDMREVALRLINEGNNWTDYRLVFSDSQKEELLELSQKSEKELSDDVYKDWEKKRTTNNKTKINTFKRREFAVSIEADITALNFQITFTSIKENQLNSLKNLIDSWADVGLFGGYKGQLHNFSGASIIEKGVEAVMDMGNADIEVAIGTLQDILNQFAKLESLEISELKLF